MAKTIQTAFRLDEKLLQEADRLAKQLSRPGLRLTRVDVVRMALEIGFKQLKKGMAR